MTTEEILREIRVHKEARSYYTVRANHLRKELARIEKIISQTEDKLQQLAELPAKIKEREEKEHEPDHEPDTQSIR